MSAARTRGRGSQPVKAVMPTPPDPVPVEVETNGSAPDAAPPSIRAEVLIAGAGIVGLALGVGLARQGLDVVVAGRINASLPGRTVALLNGSIAFLENMGLWSDLETRSEPLRVMRIVDATRSLFQAPPVAFRAEEIGQAWFGRNIVNEDLVRGLARAAREEPRLTLVDKHLVGFAFDTGLVTAHCEDGQDIRAPLVAASDGRNSTARQAAGIPVKSWRYDQTAISAILRHERPHDDVSTEFHTRQGPFTLVPLPGTPQAPHRSSLVWVMRPEGAKDLAGAGPARLAREIDRQSRGLLGRVGVEGRTGSFPITGMIADRMTADRTVLVGEAAHVLPPIGAQGLNLGLRDVAALVGLLGEAKRRGADLGAATLLDRYARARRGDVALRAIGVDRLNRSLLSTFLPGHFIRGAGLQALGRVAPLRRIAMRAGLGEAR